MFIFQYGLKRVAPNPPKTTVERNADFFRDETQNFVISLNLRPKDFQTVLNMSLGNMASQKPAYYRKNFTPISINAHLDGSQVTLANKIYNELTGDEAYRNRVKNAYRKVGAENPAELLQQHTAMVSNVLSQFVSNLKANVEEVHVQGQLLYACIATECVSFNLLDAMKKMEKIGQISPGINPAAIAGKSNEKTFTKIFGEGAKQDLAGVMGSISKAVINAINQMPPFNAPSTDFQQPSLNAGNAIYRNDFLVALRDREEKEDRKRNKKIADEQNGNKTA